MSKGMAIYTARLMTERLLGLVLYLLGAAWHIGPRAIIWFVTYFVAAILGACLYHSNAELMDRRANIASTKDVTPVWDKVILAAFWLLSYFVIYFAAGATVAPSMPVGPSTVLGIALYVASTVLTLWALRTNAYAESVSRVQNDRNQRVCSSGPYAFVRHPMYSAILLFCVAIVLVFPSITVGVISLVVAILIVVRTLLEDAMLAEGLAGYDAYRRKVPARLVPHVF